MKIVKLIVIEVKLALADLFAFQLHSLRDALHYHHQSLQNKQQYENA